MSPLWYQFLGVIIGADQLRSPRELEAVRRLCATAEREREVERGTLLSRDGASRASLMRQLASEPQVEVIEGLDQAWRIAASDQDHSQVRLA
jgi:uncharacterized tellurite resistance protein B-like protein